MIQEHYQDAIDRLTPREKIARGLAMFDWARGWISRQVIAVLRPEHHVPVAGHHAVAADPHASDPERLGDRLDEALVVGGGFEDRPPADRPVHDVKRHTAR
jgi:hypothetical protein